MKVLVLDIGGTNVKVLATDQPEPRKIPSGTELTPERMIGEVLATVKDWDFEAVTVGYPGPISHGQIAAEPRNLGTGWVGFDFAARLARPVKIINDAAMQAVGSYDGGRMLFMGLGTGLGTALVLEHAVAPLELAHLPYKKKRTYEDYLGERGLKRMGREKWQRTVEDVVVRFKDAFVVDYIVLGGGNSKKLLRVPDNCRLGSNQNAFTGGFRLWEEAHEMHRARFETA